MVICKKCGGDLIPFKEKKKKIKKKKKNKLKKKKEMESLENIKNYVQHNYKMRYAKDKRGF